MPELTKERLAEIEARAAKAVRDYDPGQFRTEHDWHWDIVKTDIPDLIAAVRELQAENKRLRGDLARQQQLNINQAKTIRSWQCRPIEAARDGGEG